MELSEDPISHTEYRHEQAGPLPASAAAFYRSLFLAATDAILVADENGRYLEANEAAASLLGYTREELLGMRVAEVVASGAQWAEAEYERFMSEGTWSGELELRRRDGMLVPVEAHATVVQWPIYLSVIRDISARRAAEQAQREFLAMVTHELKTPLTGILGHAELQRRQATYSARHTEAIITQATHLERLLNDLLDAARAANGRLELRPSILDLAKLARDAATYSMAVNPTHPVRLIGPQQPIIGHWDADRVAQILQNLLANAGKYAWADSEILICLEDLGKEVLVSVCDQGAGVAPEDLPRLFDRFYRTESAARNGAPGLGLGLNICKQLVEDHGGRIWIKSEVGHGTTVFFTLPYDLAQDDG